MEIVYSVKRGNPRLLDHFKREAKKLARNYGVEFFMNSQKNCKEITIRGDATSLFKIHDSLKEHFGDKLDYEFSAKESGREVSHEDIELQKKYEIAVEKADKYKRKAKELDRKRAELEEKVERLEDLLKKERKEKETLIEKMEREYEKRIKDYPFELLENPSLYFEKAIEYNKERAEAIKNYYEACKEGIADELEDIKEIPPEAKLEWEETEYYRKNVKKYQVAKKVLEHVEKCRESGIEIDESILSIKPKRAQKVVREFEAKQRRHEKLHKIAEYMKKPMEKPKVVVNEPPTKEKVIAAFREQVGFEPADGMKFDLIIVINTDYLKALEQLEVRWPKDVILEILEIDEKLLNKYKSPGV